jgi:hypothetical protein
MAVVPPYFSPIAFPDVSLAERFIASFWANAQEEYRFKRKAALQALDPRTRAIMHKTLQESLTEALANRASLIEQDRSDRAEIVKDYLSELGQNARNLQNNQADIAKSRISARGNIETESMKIQRANQAAMRRDPEANSIIEEVRTGSKFRPELTLDGWTQKYLNDPAGAQNMWTNQSREYVPLIERLSKTTGRGDAQRREALAAQLQEAAIERGDIVGANVIAAQATGRPDFKNPVFQLRDGSLVAAAGLTAENAVGAKPVLRLNLMTEYRQNYGPVTDADIERRQRRATRGGVGAAQSIDLDAMLLSAGLDKPVDVSVYDTRIDSLRKSLKRSQIASRQESAARSAILSGQAFDPYISSLEEPTSELRLIDEIAKVYQQSPAAGRRILDEAFTGQLEPGAVESVVFETFATFSNALADRLDDAGNQETLSELSWLPYEYDDQINNLSSVYTSGDREAYKQQVVSLRNDIDLMDPKLAGDAGRTIVNQVDLALDTDNFDTLNSRLVELNDSIQNWIVESERQMAGLGS